MKKAIKLFGFFIGLSAVFSVNAQAETIYGLTVNNALISFDSALPGTVITNNAITGLGTGENLLGIDFRPATNTLYGLGSTGQLYTINTSTGAATAVGAPVALNGSAFGFDFNPTVDRIRVVSDADQNLRLNPNNGALAATDPNVAYAGGDPRAGSNPTVVGSAYTNSFPGATTTTLYNIDITGGTAFLTTQNPANAGTLNSVGSLNVAVTSDLGFDISGLTGVAYASLTSPGANVAQSNLFSVNLATGASTFIGTIGTVDCNKIRDIAVVVPEPGSIAALLVGAASLIGLRKRSK